MEDLLSDVSITPELASKRKRWTACLIDYIICCIVWCIIVFSFGDVVINDEGNQSWQITGLPGFFAIFIPWFILLPGIEAITKGKTIGKAVFHIKSVRLDGSKITPGLAIARHLLDFVDFLPFFGIVGIIVASNNSLKQRVGDLVASTIVIEAKD